MQSDDLANAIRRKERAHVERRSLVTDRTKVPETVQITLRKDEPFARLTWTSAMRTEAGDSIPALVVDAHLVALAADVRSAARLARAVDAQLAG